MCSHATEISLNTHQECQVQRKLECSHSSTMVVLASALCLQANMWRRAGAGGVLPGHDADRGQDSLPPAGHTHCGWSLCQWDTHPCHCPGGHCGQHSPSRLPTPLQTHPNSKIPWVLLWDLGPHYPTEVNWRKRNDTWFDMFVLVLPMSCLGPSIR